MIPELFINQLKKLVGAARVITDRARLESVSKDETHGLAAFLPEVLVQPVSTHEVQQIMKLCAMHTVNITPRGAGTGKSGGCVPVHGGVVLDFSKMNRILKIDSENLIAVVEAGVVLAELQEAVQQLKLFYPPDPASAKWCTIGGNIAENASGPSSVKYGSTRDYVLGLQAVLPTGEIIQTGKSTHKGVTGYDLTALLCGSEGTLALVTQATLKLLPMPRAIQTAMLAFASEHEAALAVTAILQGGFLPKSLEYMDSACLEALHNNNKGHIFPANSQAALIIEVDADSLDSAFSSITSAVALAQNHGVTQTILAQDEKQRRQIWESRNQLSEIIKRLKAYKVSEDIVVPRSKIPDLVQALRKLSQKYGLKTCAFGHAGDGNLHAQILFDAPDEKPTVALLLNELFQVTIEMGGTLTGEHGIGIAKQDYLRLEQSEELIALQRRLKNAFDPLGILNPGKFLPT